MDFFRTASSPPCRCLPRHPLSGSVHDVLRARATPGEGPKKKIQPSICRVGGLFNCDIQYLFAIHLIFFQRFRFPSVCPCLSYRGFSFLSLCDFRGVELAHKGSSLVNLPTVLFFLFLFSSPRYRGCSGIIMRLIRPTHPVH